MKLTENVYNRIVATQKQHIRLKALFFENFKRGAEFLTDEEAPIKGLTLTPSLEGNYFDISYLDMQIRFAFFTYYGADDVLTGKVVALRKITALTSITDVIGNFSFDIDETTDFEVAEGDKKIEIGYRSKDILLHFIELAILKPMTLPATS